MEAVIVSSGRGSGARLLTVGTGAEEAGAKARGAGLSATEDCKRACIMLAGISLTLRTTIPCFLDASWESLAYCCNFARPTRSHGYRALPERFMTLAVKS